MRDRAIRLRGRCLAQEPVEPLAGVLRADVEDLLTFGRGERSEGRCFNRNVFQLDLIVGGCRLQARCLAFAFTCVPACAAD